MEILLKKYYLAYNNNMIITYIIKQERLYQNKVNSSLFSNCNCKMGYCETSFSYISMEIAEGKGSLVHVQCKFGCIDGVGTCYGQLPFLWTLGTTV